MDTNYLSRAISDWTISEAGFFGETGQTKEDVQHLEPNAE